MTQTSCNIEHVRSAHTQLHQIYVKLSIIYGKIVGQDQTTKGNKESDAKRNKNKANTTNFEELRLQ